MKPRGDEAARDNAKRESLGHVAKERVCYTCRARYTEIHWFYGPAVCHLR